MRASRIGGAESKEKEKGARGKDNAAGAGQMLPQAAHRGHVKTQERQGGGTKKPDTRRVR
ncbi:hypothetical protein A9975_03400 [Cupriavidus sp. UME77]|nr:hypothetical protein [Cupriavidus sp. UME77]